MGKLKYLRKNPRLHRDSSEALQNKGRECKAEESEETLNRGRRRGAATAILSCDLQFGTDVQPSQKWPVSTRSVGSYVINNDNLLFQQGGARVCYVFREAQQSPSVTECFQKTRGEKWNSSEEPLQRQQRRSLRGREAAGICSATWHLCWCSRAVGWLMRRTTLVLTHAYTLSSAVPYSDTRTHSDSRSRRNRWLTLAFVPKFPQTIESRTFLCGPVWAAVMSNVAPMKTSQRCQIGWKNKHLGLRTPSRRESQ